MRFGAPTLGDRVAPRSIYAEGILLVTVANGRIIQHRHLNATIRTPADLTAILEQNNVDTLVTGGVGKTVRQLLATLGIHIIDNVSQTTESLLQDIVVEQRFCRETGMGLSTALSSGSCPYLADKRYTELNCLSCAENACLLGNGATNDMANIWDSLSPEDRRILEAATDIAKESPRRLCRLSEIIYFCIEMRYQRIGLAYCTDMADAARILENILSRFFEVIPVYCKVGGIRESALYSENGPWLETEETSLACNPLGQAYVLDRAETQFNLVVGLCVGADALFGRATKAPASTLFVKDKSLANNPIGALYSEYYLKESVSQATSRPSKPPKASNREET